MSAWICPRCGVVNGPCVIRGHINDLEAALAASGSDNSPESCNIASVAEWPCENCGQARRKHLAPEDGPLLCYASPQTEYVALREHALRELLRSGTEPTREQIEALSFIEIRARWNSPIRKYLDRDDVLALFGAPTRSPSVL